MKQIKILTVLSIFTIAIECRCVPGPTGATGATGPVGPNNPPSDGTGSIGESQLRWGEIFAVNTYVNDTLQTSSLSISNDLTFGKYTYSPGMGFVYTATQSSSVLAGNSYNTINNVSLPSSTGSFWCLFTGSVQSQSLTPTVQISSPAGNPLSNSLITIPTLNGNGQGSTQAVFSNPGRSWVIAEGNCQSTFFTCRFLGTTTCMKIG